MCLLVAMGDYVNENCYLDEFMKIHVTWFIVQRGEVDV